MSVRLAHDLNADALYITLTDVPVARTIEIDPCTMVDVDANGQPVGIEVISPRRHWPLTEITQRFTLDPADVKILTELYGNLGAHVEQVSPAPLDSRVA